MLHHVTGDGNYHLHLVLLQRTIEIDGTAFGGEEVRLEIVECALAEDVAIEDALHQEEFVGAFRFVGIEHAGQRFGDEEWIFAIDHESG